MAWHRSERADLVTALREIGPGRPTLCEGWSTEHLAAHVVLRERAPLVALGAVLPPLHERSERAIRALGGRSTTPRGWAELLDLVAAGPRPWHPLRWAGDGPQLAELFVHTEDVRRGEDLAAVAPRRQDAGHVDALWRTVRRSARLLVRGLPVRVRLDTPGREPVTIGPRGRRLVVLRGEPGEVLLWVFGRSEAARVTLEGDAAAVARLRAVRPTP